MHTCKSMSAFLLLGKTTNRAVKLSSTQPGCYYHRLISVRVTVWWCESQPTTSSGFPAMHACSPASGFFLSSIWLRLGLKLDCMFVVSDWALRCHFISGNDSPSAGPREGGKQGRLTTKHEKAKPERELVHDCWVSFHHLIQLNQTEWKECLKKTQLEQQTQIGMQDLLHVRQLKSPYCLLNGWI